MRVEQTAIFLSDALKDVYAGRMVAPVFQRPYVWSKQDVEAFWRSMMKGWPIGSMLFWEPRPGEASNYARGRIGPISVDPDSHPRMILDGQNRLATFAWSMAQERGSDLSDAFDMERATWLSGETLVADPETRSVRFVPDAEAEAGARVKAGLLSDSEALWKVVRKRGDAISDEDLKWLAEDASYSIRNARVGSTTLMGGTVDEVIEAFVHVARGGVPVSEDDLRAAIALSADTLRGTITPGR